MDALSLQFSYEKQFLFEKFNEVLVKRIQSAVFHMSLLLCMAFVVSLIAVQSSLLPDLGY